MFHSYLYINYNITFCMLHGNYTRPTREFTRLQTDCTKQDVCANAQYDKQRISFNSLDLSTRYVNFTAKLPLISMQRNISTIYISFVERQYLVPFKCKY